MSGNAHREPIESALHLTADMPLSCSGRPLWANFRLMHRSKTARLTTSYHDRFFSAHRRIFRVVPSMPRVAILAIIALRALDSNSACIARTEASFDLANLAHRAVAGRVLLERQTGDVAAASSVSWPPAAWAQPRGRMRRITTYSGSPASRMPSAYLAKSSGR